MKSAQIVGMILLGLSLAGCPGNQPNSTPASPSTGTSASPSTPSANPGSPSASPTNSAAASGGFAFVGVDADKVAHGTNEVKPDGKKDMHFTLTHTFPQPNEVREVSIYTTKNGARTSLVGWTTDVSPMQVLLVEANGKAMNTQRANNLGPVSGTVKFDFYGSVAPFESLNLGSRGEEYTMHITMNAGEPLSFRVVL